MGKIIKAIELIGYALGLCVCGTSFGAALGLFIIFVLHGG